MDIQNQNNDDQWIQIDQPLDIIPTAIDFPPINTPEPVDCFSKDSKPHDYFLHLLGEEFLDNVITDTNLHAERKSQLKVTLEVYLYFVNENLQIVKSFWANS